MRTVTIVTTCVLCCAALAARTALAAAQQPGDQTLAFYVAAGGNDAWSGTLPEPNGAGTDGPLASVARAQELIRALRAPGQVAKPVTVLIRGVHRLAEPIVFTPEDSGTAECPVTYTAYPGEKPVLSGGRVITGWQKAEGELWTAELPEVKSGAWHFRQLFVDGRRARRARSPNEGYLHVESLVDPKPTPSSS